MADKNKRYYIHFETKPPFADLDVFFDKCLQYEPVMATSYKIVTEPSMKIETLFEFAEKCFNRYHFALMPTTKALYRHEEAEYIKADIPPAQ